MTVPDRPSAARSLGFAWFASLTVAFLTGAVLGLHYVPIVGRAWESTFFLHQLPAGAAVRALHRSAAETAVVCGGLGLVLGAFERRDGRARRILGWAASVGMALTLFICVTGNPLRFDNASFFALRVESSVLRAVPGIGGALQRLLTGSGDEEGLLSRLYARHSVLLPAALALVVSASIALARRIEGAEPGAQRSAPAATSQLISDVSASLLAVLTISVLAAVRGAPLGSPADPSLSFPARPVWYLQVLFVAREALPTTGVGRAALSALVLLVGAMIFAYSALRSNDPGERRRLRVRVTVALGSLAYGLLTAVGLVRDGRAPELNASFQRERWEVERVRVLTHGGVPRDALALLEADPLHRARRVFAENCANCHSLADLGPSKGKPPAPALDGFGRRRWVLELLDDPDSARLFGGSPFAGTMRSMTRPPEDPEARAKFRPLAEADRTALATFLEAQAFPGNVSPASSAELARGEKLVAERCTSCHLFRGHTDDDESDAPELSGWGSEDYIRAQIQNPASGVTYRKKPRQKGAMPAYAGLLSSEEVDLLVDLIRNQLVDGNASQRSLSALAPRTEGNGSNTEVVLGSTGNLPGR